MFTKSYTEYTIQEGFPEALVKLDFQEHFIYVNKIAAELLSSDPAEIMGKHIWTVFPETKSQPIYEAFQKSLKDKQHVYLEEYNATHDRWFENHIYQTDTGTTICYRDITERKRKELLSKNNETRYQLIFENSMDGVALLDEHGKIYSVNRAVCKMFGRSEDEIYQLGRDGLLDITETRFTAFIKKRAEKGYAYGELTGIKKDGTKFLIDINSNEFTDAKGEKLIHVVMRDKTEINEAKQTINEQYHTLHSLIESISNPVFSLDTHYCYTCFNKAHAEGMKKIYGKEIQLGGCLLDYQTTEDARIAKPNIDRALAGEYFIEESDSGDELHSRLSYEIAHNPVKDATGKIIGVTVEAIDITDRKLAEHRLKVSEQEFRLLAENAKDLIFHYEFLPERRFTYVSPSSTLITGYSPEEHYADPDLVLKIIHPDFISVFEQINKGKLDNVAGVTLRIIRKDGTLIWTEQHNTTIYNDEGEIVAIEGIARDITERKNAELQLQESEQRFRTMIDQAPLGIALIDSLTGHIYEVNERFATIAGRSKEEMVTIDWMKITHPDDVQEDLDNMALLNSGKINGFHREKRYVHPDGKLVWINMTIVPIKREEFISARHLCMVEDITERKQAEALANETMDKLLKISNRVPGVIYQFRMNPDGTSCFPYVSDKIREIYQVSPEEVKFDATKVTEVIHPDDLEGVVLSILDSAKKLPQWKQEYRVKYKDGTVRAVYGSAMPQREEDGSILWHGYITDITERRQADEAIRASEERYKSILTASPDGIAITDLEGRVLITSPVTAKMFGFAKEEALVGQLITDYIVPEDRPLAAHNIELMFKGVMTGLGEYRALCKDGSVFNIEANAEFIKDSSGTASQIVFIVRDISPRKKVEEQLKETQHFISEAQRISKLGSFKLNVLTQEWNFSSELNKNFGMKPSDEHTLQAWKKMIHPDHQDMVSEYYLTVISKKRRFYKEYKIINPKTSKEHWVSQIGDLKIDEAGNPVEMIGTIQDITQRKEAEELLHDKDKLYKSLIENGNDAVLILDEEGIIKYVSPSITRVLGYTEDETIGTSIFGQMHPDDLVEGKKIIKNTLNNPDYYTPDFIPRILHKDGSWRWIAGTLSNKLHDPVIAGMVDNFRDVTEQVMANKAIAEKTAQLENLSDNLPETMIYQITLEPDGNLHFTYVSRASERLIGKTAEEVLDNAMILYDIILTEDREKLMAAEMDSLMNMTIINLDLRIRKPNGDLHWINVRSLPRKLANGGIIWDGLCADISDRKKAQKGLEDYRFALNESSIVDVSDSSGAIQYVNENFTKISGYSLEELKGRGHRILKSGSYNTTFYKSLWQTITAGQVWRSEMQNKAKNGNLYWVDTTIVPFLDEFGKPFQFIAIRKDITNRKIAEATMQDALNRYDIVSNATSDTIWDWDIKNDRIFYNQGIAKTFGYTDLHDSPGMDWWLTKVSADDNQRVMELVNYAFDKMQETLHFEYRFLCANGKYKYVADRSFVMYDNEGVPERMIGSMQDITNEKEFAIRIEKEVIEAQEREWNQIGMELHDNVNQLLAASILMMGLAKVKMEQGLDASSIFAESEKHVGEAITEIRKLSHQLAPVSVYNLSLQQVFESLIKTINVNKQFVVTLEMSEFKDVQIPYKLQVNLYRILQAQLNNIIKYAQASEIIISLKKSQNDIVFSIADNGIGFDPEKHHNGIGLENIRRRAKVFAGTFILNTTVDKGCEVLVKIPLYMLEQE